MRPWLRLVIVLGLLVVFTPTVVAGQRECFASIQEQAALREATERLALAYLHPHQFSFELDLSGHAYLTRAQVVLMTIRTLGWETYVGQVGEPSPFSDVPADHWAAKYVTLAWNEGIVKGEPGGTFSPNRRVTMSEAELILGRALRVAPSLTLDNASQALSKAGISTSTSCNYEDGKEIDFWQYLLILDRAMATPLYNRFSASPGGTAP